MIIKRSLYLPIQAHLEKPEITLIAGPRQCGKTFLMELLIDYLQKRGQKILFLNLDIEEDKKYFSSQKALLSKIELEFGSQKGFVFIDEIQRKSDAGLFLKGIYDLQLPHKFIVSGSGSLELQAKIHESLAGRKKVFDLKTISFVEFLNFKTSYQYEDRLQKFFAVEKESAKNYLLEYLRFGGYPKVVLNKTLSEKQDAIREIFQSYVERDLSALLHLEKTEVVFQLLKLLSENAGNLVNMSSMANTLGISIPTVKNYLWYLEKTFIINRVSPFTRRAGREISKSPVVYFVDIGLRNFVTNTFTSELSPKDLGFNFQNLIFNALQEQFSERAATIHYFRTKDGAEVDFVVELGPKIFPIEAKFNWNKSLPRGLQAFVERYQSEPGKIITADNFHSLLNSNKNFAS